MKIDFYVSDKEIEVISHLKKLQDRRNLSQYLVNLIKLDMRASKDDILKYLVAKLSEV